MKKVSVIIPCYNVESYIDRCFNSLVNQTIGMEHLELIFINDESTDCTMEKLLQYEQQYPENIILINFETNQRQGTARNTGYSMPLHLMLDMWMRMTGLNLICLSEWYRQLKNMIVILWSADGILQRITQIEDYLTNLAKMAIWICLT